MRKVVIPDLITARKINPILIGFRRPEIIAHAVLTEPRRFARRPFPKPSTTGSLVLDFIRYFLSVLLGVIFLYPVQVFVTFWSLSLLSRPSHSELHPAEVCDSRPPATRIGGWLWVTARRVSRVWGLGAVKKHLTPRAFVGRLREIPFKISATIGGENEQRVGNFRSI